ncbi:PD-(D/E)XK nuclease family protein [Uliginosibacterium sp. H1]|uniref:PD-(D/E)XK nuclease family protein n=1 Tax=Uliginosibacterium sp. H1 TaxID=3114757 RepID=UPI002E18166D|nr:PD-(D/E)XK nuclease family protein [Uliginosibacterium sp. H1]
MTLVVRSIAPDAGFLPAAAQEILSFAGLSGRGGDLSAGSLLLPNLKLLPALSLALRTVAGGALLLPRTDTLSGLVAPWQGALEALPDARRQLILHTLLRGREWFDEGMLWDVVAELTQLFDILTEHAVALPEDEASLLARLETAFSLRHSQALAFEARVVNTLWRAEAQGKPSHATARLLAAGHWVAQLDGPLIVMLESTDPGPLQALIEVASARVPVLVLRPDRRLAQGALAELLACAWPLAEAAPMRDRTAALAPQIVLGAGERLQMVAAESLEDLGQAVADQVLDWLREGRREIALVACDRLAARRARALLERQHVLVQDETGWKMVTTRVAAVVDAWLEVLATDAWHRALIDLLRAPLLFADIDPMVRGRAADAIDRLIRQRGISSGLDVLRQALLTAEGAGIEAAKLLLGRLADARAVMMSSSSTTIADWLRRLLKSLELLGALPQVQQDAAGAQWLDWLEARQAELSQDEARFRFPAWRVWFNRQMEAQLFRDERIDSPIIMTHLAAARLRSFEAVIVIGADAEHLAPPVAPGWLTHAGVRRELGLPDAAAERIRMREDLAGLLLACDRSVIAWQSLRRDEEVLPAAEVSVLLATTGLAGGSDRPLAVHTREPLASPEVAPTVQAAPALPQARVPVRLSASGMQTLVDCPYRYFARYVLGLAEVDELGEGMEKQDFGTQLHAILHEFHTRFPVLAGQDDAELLAALDAISEAAFRDAVQRNFQDHAWRLRWRGQLADYLAWQRSREAEGWHWRAGEKVMAQEHELGANRSLTLQGRIDRVDEGAGEHGDGNLALLDYKSRALKSLRDQVADMDDVQLAFYTLLAGTHVGSAAYVALDGHELGTAELDAPEDRAGQLHDVITRSFNAMYDGAALPAQGTERACAWCEMRGLCRKGWAGGEPSVDGQAVSEVDHER